MKSVILRRRLVATTVILAGLAIGLTAVPTTSPVQAADPQVIFFNGSVRATPTAYAQPSIVSIPNYLSPVDYANGRLLWKLDITAKPSTKPMTFAICMWQHGTRNYQYETCSSAVSASTTGVKWADLGAPFKWWRIASGYNWAKAPDVIRFMIKDAATQKLMMTSSCGAYCYTGTDIAQHTPISMTSSAVLVPKGGTFVPPSFWTGCPAAWSSACSGGGGTSSTAASTSSTAASTSTTAASTSTTTTVPNPTGKDVVVLAGSTSASGDRPIIARLRTLGWNVTVVDDDTVTTTKVAGAELIVITSSVVPTKVPTWLATLAKPIVSSEAYAFSRLRIASTGSESIASQLNITTAASPVKGSLSGLVSVTAATALGSGKPVASAVIVATIAGQPSKAAVFTIETGRALTTGTAPARRVGFFFGYSAPATATAAAWTLFDNAVKWAAP